MRKRTLWIAFGALAGLWIVPAAFVAIYDPTGAGTPRRTEPQGPIEAALGRREPRVFLLSHGYTKHWTVETWEGEEQATADKASASYFVERGPLDRRTGKFRLTVSLVADHALDLEGARLFVTSDGDWSGGGETVWTRVVEAAVKEPGAEVVTVTCEAVVPASTTAYRLVELRRGVECCGFSQSMLTAPTFLGRVYDTIAWWPSFRWLPDLH
jgi:hypothetical protein